MSIIHLYYKIIFAALRKKIKKSPYIGQGQDDGTHLYTKGSYSINYRKSILPDGKLCIEWVSHKRRLGPYEEKIRRTKKGFLEFWYYQRWLVLFRPPLIFLLIIGVFLFYYGVLETQEAKIERLKLIVASAVGINTQDIQYIGDGWLEISGQRKKVADGTTESVKYTFNPLRWLFSSDTGFVKRWLSGSGEYVKYPVVYNEKGDVWLKEKDTWQHGIISDQNIKWDIPQGTAGVAGHQVSTEDKKLKIIDK